MTQAARRKWSTWQLIALNTGFSLGLLLLGISLAQAGMYRWVDSNGRVQYGDTLPTTYQQSGAAELSKQGQVIKRTASSTERAAEAARLAEQAKLKQAADEQARMDRALTSTYTTEAEIDLSRDRALAHHELVIKGAEVRAKVVATNMKELEARIGTLTQAKKTVPPNLQMQLEQTQSERKALYRTIIKNKEAMLQVREKYDADKQRFKLLAGKTAG
ncbi:MAG: DUF4124 domain-containing protein [Thiobacillus sp.]